MAGGWSSPCGLQDAEGIHLALCPPSERWHAYLHQKESGCDSCEPLRLAGRLCEVHQQDQGDLEELEGRKDYRWLRDKPQVSVRGLLGPGSAALEKLPDFEENNTEFEEPCSLSKSQRAQ